MKTLLVVAACACLGLSADAGTTRTQPGTIRPGERNSPIEFGSLGTVNFANKVGATVDAPVFDGCRKRLLGPGYVAQLWAGPVGGRLVAVGDPIPFRTSTAAAGYWFGEARTIPGIRAGADAVIEVRVWRVAAGKTYQEAWESSSWDGCGANAGSSPAITVKTGGFGEPPSLPFDLYGLTSFGLYWVPEPTTWALLLGGSGVLLFRLQGQHRKDG